MPDSSNPDHFSEVAVCQDTGGLANPLNTPFSGVSLSQLGSDSAYSFLDFDISGETIPGTNKPENTESGDQAGSLQNQMSCGNSRNDIVTLDWLELGYDENLHQHNTVQRHSLLGTKADSGGATCILALFSERIVADKVETRPCSTHRTYRIAALFQNADGGSRRQQTVLDRVNVLLSSNHQTCFSSLLRKIDSGREHQSLDLNDLSMRKLIQRAFKEPGGLNLFIKEQDVTRIQEQFVDLGNLPIDVSDMSLLIVSLAWGALLDPEVSSVSRAALLDAVLEISTLLLRQNGSVRQFLALVAVLGLAEKTGSEKLHTLILGSISTAASLNLHLEPVLRKFCTSDEQAIQTKRAMWLLYCIDKSYALRWQTFSLVSEGSLPITNPSDSIIGNDVATTHSSEWLWIRAQYSKICSNILQLRVSAEEEPSKDHSNRAVALSTALGEWYKSTRVSQMILSLDYKDAMRIKLQTSYYYYEARVQLLSISLPDTRSSSPAESQEYRELLKQSTRETISLSSTMSSEYLLQDWYVSHKVVSLTIRLY
ncbi:Fungal-trans domain containing protein [Pyrenophora tritici-repentis]|uniref:Fungal-trans domain containing protein n=1 Tax=Pyrenophora tritici-repentis TaxID=45151 RepID=A0A317AGS5_9PLEO|nr:Fungal-trans domain containing protein [Pyrenophora tritici-repentis]KAI1507546.1 hypothetical protein Ptr86124_013480 [Pyrenophora tritici-repentis]KAI1523436.1 Fungal-trans domain containing protein [Pyrenophora tritici-repentis]KAI1527464.1 Fungal-trans domain containing protein [Pyrenophora tritici-repentis]KAI1685709.1 hypothetical protein KJE20_03674 [Pyrenophora tritici-repentis]